MEMISDEKKNIEVFVIKKEIIKFKIFHEKIKFKKRYYE